MSEEEKKAIDILQNCIADYVIGEYCEKCGDRLVCNDRNEDCYFQQAIDTVVNLIEKLEKELKEEKEKNKKLEIELEIKKYCKVDELTRDLIYYKNLAKEYQGNCISKDKIRDLIAERKFELQQEYEDFENDIKLKILQELLEE